MRRFFKKRFQEQSFLESDENLNPEVYNYLNAVIKLDTNGHVVSYNQAFLKQYGYEEEEFDQPFFDLLLKNNSREISKYFENAILGKVQRFHTQGYRKNGNQLDISISLIPIRSKEIEYIYVILNDISEYEKQQDELHLFYKMREAFDEVDYICSFYYDAINDYYYPSKQIKDMLKINPENTFTPSLKHALRYVHPDDQERVQNIIQTSLHKRIGYEIEYRMVQSDQTIILVQEQAGILLDKNGNLEGMVGFIQDITDHKCSKNVLEIEKQIKLLYDNPDVGFWSIDLRNGRYGNTSKGIELITGYTNEDFQTNLKWTSVVYHEDLQQYLNNQHILADGKILKHEYRIVHKNGGIRWIQDYTIPTLDSFENIVRLDGLVSDITEQKLMQDKVTYLANFDPLTNLPNRNHFIEMLDRHLKEISNPNHQFAVVKLDIDGFKYINATLGNKIGNELLKQIPNRIKGYLTEQDIIARRGGDEFFILIDGINSIDDLKITINKIMNGIGEPFNIEGYELYITVTIGISTYPENGMTSLELLRNANLALNNAQKRGRNNYYILSQSSSIQSFKNYGIGRDLKKAIEDREFTIYYQPRVDAKSNKIISAEALIRWNHPEWGIVSPAEFLSFAEENGLISEIDDWVFSEVCHQIKKWKDASIPVVPISINISAMHFLKQEWTRKVASIIREAGIHPSDIEFEITESTILNHSDMVKNTILKLKELGISIALDDFGTGYSSLSYLTQYPFDVIKIDKSFIRNMNNSKRDLHLTKSIIYMAKGLQLRVVAEGVETVSQLTTLQNEECFEVQGYLYSRPVPVHEFELLLQNKILKPTITDRISKLDRRKHNRVQLTDPLEADIRLVSIAGRCVELGVSKVLIENISIGGLQFVSNLKLPIRGDVIYQFKTEFLGEDITLKGCIVWKDEVNEELTAHGIQFEFTKEERAKFSKLLNSFIVLASNSTSLPPYQKITVDRYEYFK